jgi:hypothetical protein
MASQVQKGKPVTPAKKMVAGPIRQAALKPATKSMTIPKPIQAKPLPAKPALKPITVPKPVAAKPKPAAKPSGFMGALQKAANVAYTYSGAQDIVQGGKKIAQSGILPGGKKADWGQAALGLGQGALGAAGFIPGAGLAVRGAVGGAKALSAGSKVLKATKAAQTVAKTPVARAAANVATKVKSPITTAIRPAATAIKKPLAAAAKPLVKTENYLNKGLLKGTGKTSKILNATVANRGALALIAGNTIPSIVSGYNQAMAQPASLAPSTPAPDNRSYSVPAPIPSTQPKAPTYKVPPMEPDFGPSGQGTVPPTDINFPAFDPGPPPPPGINSDQTIYDTGFSQGTETTTIPTQGIETTTMPTETYGPFMGENTMQYAPNAADYLTQSQGMQSSPGAFQSQTTPDQTGAAPLLGAAQVAGMNYAANLAGAASTANANEAGIREALSQRLMGAQGGAADIIGGRSAGILGQGITGARRSYVTETAGETRRALSEQDALRRQYGSELSQAYDAQAQKVLDAAKARAEAAAQIRKYGVA